MHGNTPTVVIDRQNNGFVVGFDADPNGASFRLADQTPRVGQLDAVNDGVFEQVQQRLDEHVDDLGVDLNLAVLDLDYGFFVLVLAGHIYRTTETRFERAEFDHSNLKQFCLDVVGQPAPGFKKRFQLCPIVETAVKFGKSFG